VIDRATWTPQPIFGYLAEQGEIPADQLDLAFNLGIGMIAIVAPAARHDALALASARGLPAWVAGVVRSGSGKATVVAPRH
jgi:phosphoribosylformylglycinamidine cyclo-ligase